MPPDYYVKTTIDPRTDGSKPIVTERLVRAKNQAAALAHVVKDTVAVERASTDTIVRLTKAGVAIEEAD